MQRIRLRYVVIAATAVALALVVRALAPVYGFYSHRGKLPLPPTGWLSLPTDAPSVQQALIPSATQAGLLAIEALERHRAAIHAPALTAAVARDGKLVWVGAVGWADVASATPALPDTRFRIGSTSKILTATLFARLVDRGTVDPDDLVAQHLSPLPNPAWEPITLRQLASHSSGLPHYKRNTDMGLYYTIALNRHFDDVRDAVSLFDESKLLHEPGSAFYYSTLGTVLLGASLSEAAGRSYRDLMRDEVLTPLNLSSVIVAPPSASGTRNMATSYLARDEQFRRWRKTDLSHRLPGGGFAATSSDLAQLGVAWLDPKFIASATRVAFWTPQTLASGDVNPQNYALGFRWREKRLDDGRMLRHANHGGVSRGAQSWLMVLPDHNMSIAINTNRTTEHFGDFANVYLELVELFVDDEND